MTSGLFKNRHQKTIRLQIIWIIYMHKQDLALNNPQAVKHISQASNQPTCLIYLSIYL